MTSDPRWLAAAACGLGAATLALWAFRALPGGAVALWLSPLPLFAAGIGFGMAALAAALAVASLAILFSGSALALGIFLAAFGVPVAMLVLAGDRRGRIDLALPFALLGIIPAGGILLAALMLGDEPGGLEGAMRGAAEAGLRRMGLPAHDGLVADLVRVKAAAIGFWVSMALLVNAAAAGALLARTRVIAGAPAWREARLPAWYAVLPGLALLLWLAADDEADAVQLSLLLALMVPIFLHGLAAFHRATRALRGRTMVLGGAYAALIVMSVPVALSVTGYGLYDILNGTRARRGAPPPTP
ncbi:hypothetical protein [Falsiroseomonas sp. CW058]|uniref:hypothetical protein n=1 Tax=Falsiroseomonas sp. CW058 TaxID=3388664 RepID=UPI003D30FDC7